MSESRITSPSFVKKFDFRGVYGKDIQDSHAYYLGHALFEVLHPEKVLVGWDTRESSYSLALHLLRAFKEHDTTLNYMDSCPIDYVTAAAYAMDYDLSIMVTGSHNPWDWTGLLMHTRGGDSVQGELVTKIIAKYYMVLQQQYDEAPLRLETLTNVTTDVEKLYRDKLTELIPLSTIKPYNVLVDIGDGSGGKALEIAKNLLPQVTFTAINTRGVYDASSPHTADPSNRENMQDVIQEMSTGRFDAGFAFDSDEDRVLAVDEKGTYINGSLFGSGIIAALAEIGSPIRKIGYAVDCGLSLYNTVAELQVHDSSWQVVSVPVGRSVLREMIRKETTEVNVENVGHF